MQQKTTMTTVFEPVTQTLAEKEQFATDVARQVVIFRQTLDAAGVFPLHEREQLTRRFQDALLDYVGGDDEDFL
jgi:hypothetical protein